MKTNIGSDSDISPGEGASSDSGNNDRKPAASSETKKRAASYRTGDAESKRLKNIHFQGMRDIRDTSIETTSDSNQTSQQREALIQELSSPNREIADISDLNNNTDRVLQQHQRHQLIQAVQSQEAAISAENAAQRSLSAIVAARSALESTITYERLRLQSANTERNSYVDIHGLNHMYQSGTLHNDQPSPRQVSTQELIHAIYNQDHGIAETKSDSTLATAMNMSVGDLLASQIRQRQPQNYSVTATNVSRQMLRNHNDRMVQEMMATTRRNNAYNRNAAMNMSALGLVSAADQSLLRGNIGLDSSFAAGPTDDLLSARHLLNHNRNIMSDRTIDAMSDVRLPRQYHSTETSTLQQLLQQRAALVETENVQLARAVETNRLREVIRSEETQQTAAAILQRRLNIAAATVAAAQQEINRLSSTIDTTESLIATTDPLLSVSRHHTASISNNLFQERVVNRSISLVVPMNAETDSDYLSPYQCLIRGQLEFFVSKAEDASYSVQGRKKQIRLRQVGIHCKHCCHMPHRLRGRGAVYYPTKIHGVYQVVQNMATIHLIETCNDIPLDIRNRLTSLRGKRNNTATGSGKHYWSTRCVDIGLVEDEDGIFFQG